MPAFSSIDEVPTHAITMGIQNIMAAQKDYPSRFWNVKADAIYGMIKGPVDLHRLPPSYKPIATFCVFDKEGQASFNSIKRFTRHKG